MIKYKSIDIKKIVPDQITCNNCGERIIVNTEDDTIEDVIKMNVFHNFEIQFGYGSEYDGQVMEFDLCEKCLVSISKIFRIPPKFEDKYNDHRS